MSDKPVGAESQPVIHFSMVEDDGSALCWEGDCCPEIPPRISTDIREVTCPECKLHYGTLDDLAKVLKPKVGAESGAQSDLIHEHAAKRINLEVIGEVRNAIKDAIITDQATGAADYGEAENYATRIISQAEEGCRFDSADKSGTRYILAKITEILGEVYEAREVAKHAPRSQESEPPKEKL
jgi:hypothetical protein